MFEEKHTDNGTIVHRRSKIENSTTINDNNKKILSAEDQFDREITTLNATVAKEILENGITDDNYNNNNNNNNAEIIDKKLKEIGAKTPILPSQIGTDFNFKGDTVWFNVIGFLLLHICATIGIILSVIGYTDYRTTIYSLLLIYGSGIGVTMGAHRLWSHRSFKAKPTLKLVLLWLHTLAGQNCLYIWVRDHRQHHKYSDTDADPHNANRGFFFSHVGWLMCRKHPKVIEYGKKIDMSDLEADPWIMFQKRHYKVLYVIFAFFLPTVIPIIFWNEDPICALFTAFFARAILLLNATWSVNSAAHLYGTRPFDKTIFPVESMFVAFFAVGEGWHNYHHAFPWDYRASELGTPLNLTGFLIDILANYGWVYDRKAATHNMAKNRAMRTGDDSHEIYGTADGQGAVKTLFNMWKHPLNPTYNSIYRPKVKIINENGYALIPDELTKDELDEDILLKENDEMIKQRHNATSIDLNNNYNNTGNNIEIIKQYIVEKSTIKHLMDFDENINVKELDSFEYENNDYNNKNKNINNNNISDDTTNTNINNNNNININKKDNNNNNNNNNIMNNNIVNHLFAKSNKCMPKHKNDLNINVDEVLLVKM